MYRLKDLFFVGVFLSVFGYWTFSNVDELSNYTINQMFYFGMFGTAAMLGLTVALYWQKQPQNDKSGLPFTPEQNLAALILLRSTFAWLAAATLFGFVFCNLGVVAVNSSRPELLTHQNLQAVRDFGVYMAYIGAGLITIVLVISGLRLAMARDSEAKSDLAKSTN